MADIPEVSTSSPTELLGVGRRHLAVRDFNAAAEALAKACELLAKEHGDTADQCAEAYLWLVLIFLFYISILMEEYSYWYFLFF